jgi:hypothetical protein
VLETKFVLSDLVILSEDIVGASLTFSGVVALRAKATQELKEKVKDKPIAEKSIPPTAEAGYARIEIKEVEKPSISTYKFENKNLTLELKISAVARNLQYKVPNGAPLYYVRWNLSASVEKVKDET